MRETQTANLRGPVILCVDDDPYILTALDRLLKRNGWRVMQATSGEQAVEMIEQDQIEVLLCDEAMPGMRGLDVLRRAKEVAPRTSRILLTAHCHDPNVVISAVNQCEIYRLLSKPWSDEELLQVTSAALGMTPQVWQQRKERLASRLEMIEPSPTNRASCE